MAIALRPKQDAPLADLNTTPLIDVMLVLLVMFILSIPAATHSVQINLPAPGPITEHPQINRIRNKVSITPLGVATFNAIPVSNSQLANLLRATMGITPEPELQFQPDPQAPYGSTAKVLNVIKGSGISAFGFVGNEQFTAFSKATVHPAGRKPDAPF